MNSKRIAIIGGGPSGLAAAAAATAEGMDPVVLEARQYIGGVWAPENNKSVTYASAWQAMQVNISRHSGVFSNFNWPKESADFPTTPEVYNYLHAYAQHFNLFPCIRLNSRVTKVEKVVSGWQVQWLENDIPKQDTFDAMIVASSKFNTPVIPAFPGLDKLTGKMLHVSEYKSAKVFTNKKVLIVGGSLSGASLSDELAEEADVTHLFRKPRWIIKRYRSPHPDCNSPLLPRDLLPPEVDYLRLVKRYAEQNAYPEWKMASDTPQGFVIAEDYFKHIHNNKLKPVRGEIDYFNESSVVLKDGREIQFDIVIFCTGYDPNLSYLPEHLRTTDNLYASIFPCKESNMAYVGYYPAVRGGGAAFPLLELQARLSCAVISERISLPSAERMQTEIDSEDKTPTFCGYANKLAGKLGVLPDIHKMDKSLRSIIEKGLFTPARFRLSGTHSDFNLAKKIILETETYRRTLMSVKEDISPLALLCLFKIQNIVKQTELTTHVSQIKQKW